MQDIKQVNEELDIRIAQTGRDHPIPKISERAIARMEREAALAGESAVHLTANPGSSNAP